MEKGGRGRERREERGEREKEKRGGRERGERSERSERSEGREERGERGMGEGGGGRDRNVTGGEREREHAREPLFRFLSQATCIRVHSSEFSYGFGLGEGSSDIVPARQTCALDGCNLRLTRVAARPETPRLA